KGRLVLSLVADSDSEAKLPGKLATDLHRVLLTAALASPHPDAPDAQAHPTDIAVVQGALDVGLGEQVGVKHEAELSFDPMRSFHATIAQGRLCIKGAPETLLPRCTSLLRQGETQPLEEDGKNKLLAQSEQLAGRGLRVL